jgi:hypothetical protein
MSDDESRATLPTSTLQHNIKLDAAILKKETPDRDAPWWQRRFLATLYSTWRGLFERH